MGLGLVATTTGAGSTGSSSQTTDVRVTRRPIAIRHFLLELLHQLPQLYFYRCRGVSLLECYYVIKAIKTVIEVFKADRDGLVWTPLTKKGRSLVDVLIAKTIVLRIGFGELFDLSINRSTGFKLAEDLVLKIYWWLQQVRPCPIYQLIVQYLFTIFAVKNLRNSPCLQ